jgi:hypothetical protein
MAETLNLSSPIVVPERSTTSWSIVFIGLYRRPAAVVVHLESNIGTRMEVRTLTEEEGTALLTQLNTANLSIKSLQRRALEWCATKIAALGGSVSGVPD